MSDSRQILWIDGNGMKEEDDDDVFKDETLKELTSVFTWDLNNYY